MKRVLCPALCALLLLLLSAGCQQEPLVEPVDTGVVANLSTPLVDAERAALEIMNLASFPFDAEAEVPAGAADKTLRQVLGMEREDLGGGIIHYAFTMQTGFGPCDRIVLHRVIKEDRRGRPARTVGNIFLQHGDAVGFVKFLFGPAAPSVPDDYAVAIHLARAGIDVWGIDQNWVLVPAETANFGFMAEWGVDNQVDNLRTALAVARGVRLLSGAGIGRMNLLGYSSGGGTGYALLDREAALPAWQRHVSGYVSADMLYKYGPEYEANRQQICADVDYQRSRLDGGDFVEPIPFVPLGELAANEPDADSPLIPGLTNLQAALFFSAATYELWPFSDWWHYWAGTFDPATGLPDGLRFTPVQTALDFMRTGCTWEALRFIYEYEKIICDDEDVPWDDHFSQVSVPLLIMAPVGGLGEAGVHTAGLTASTDIEILRIGLLGPDQWREDFGHIDLWTSPQAPELVWDPLLDWIRAHVDDGRPGHHDDRHGRS